MKAKPIPELTLIRGDKVQELDMVIKLFENLKGRPCTPQEIADAKAWKPKQAIKAPQR